MKTPYYTTTSWAERRRHLHDQSLALSILIYYSTGPEKLSGQ